MKSLNFMNVVWAVLAEIVVDGTLFLLADYCETHHYKFFFHILLQMLWFGFALTGPLVYMYLEKRRLKKIKIDNDNIYKF